MKYVRNKKRPYKRYFEAATDAIAEKYWERKYFVKKIGIEIWDTARALQEASVDKQRKLHKKR